MSRYLHHTPAARIPPFPRSHAPTGDVQSLDPSDIAAAAAKHKLQQQRERDEADKNDAGSVTPDDEEEIGMQECKYSDDELLKTRTPLLTGSDVADKREEIRDYFHRTFSLYERLFDVLVADSTFAMQPEKLRHPLIFYFGHTAVFFINKLRLAGLLHGRINEGMESTLAIGVDEMSWDDLNTGNYAWPTVAQVRAYRDMARLTVDDLISSLPLQLPITWESPFWIILMGCEHERIHLETSSVLFRQLPIDQVKAVPMWDHCKQFRSKLDEVPANALLTVPAGKVVAGNSQTTQQYYGWDLEYGMHTAQVASFDAAQFLCSNAEFMAFVQAGGYEDPTLWGDEGWKFVCFRKATCPVFWVPIEEEPIPGDNNLAVPTPASAVRYRYRTMTAIIDMPLDWPVDVNYIEASAFCAWKNRQRAAAGLATDGRVYRLPTESEWFRLRDHAFPEREVDEATGVTKINDQPFWASAPGNINLEHGASSCPIDQFRFAHGFFDVVGNAWQWTETPIMPFRGFQFHPMYDDFSVPTFDTRHNVFCGGSWASTGNEATRHARFAFRRHFYQHASFRYVLAEPLTEKNSPTQSMCETDQTVTHMMDAQFNDLAQAKLAASMRMLPTPNYALRIAQIAMQAYRTHGNAKMAASQPASDASGTTTLTSAGPRAIDIGCACGRSTFELAKLAANPAGEPAFTHILGLDFSTRFIRIAAQLQFDQHAEYAMRREGELITYHSIESVANAPPVSASSMSSVDAGTATAPSVLDLDLARVGMQQRVEFMQGDACNMAAKYTGYDLVVAANLLEYLYAPRQFLQSIGARMRKGGILLIASTYDWSEQFTAKAQWLGGLKDGSGESVDSARALAETLAPEFESLPDVTQDLPMLWKHNQRNYSLKFSQVTAWRKK